MKTKHFLITTEDGSAVAVVNAKSPMSLKSKIKTCYEEQLDDIIINDYYGDKWFYLAFDNTEGKSMCFCSKSHGSVYCQRIEIY